MNIVYSRPLFLLTAAGLLASAPLHAAMLGYTSTGGRADGNQGANIGLQFTADQALSVDSLGVYDNDGDGLSTAREVGLWRVSDLSLLASVVVGSGLAGVLDGGFRFAAITPVLLTVGSQYRVSVVYRSGDGPGDKLVDTVPTAAPGITLSPGTYSAGIFVGSITAPYPTTFSSLWRSTANFTLVPEPGSALLTVLGGGALLLRRRRKSNAEHYWQERGNEGK